MRILKTSKTKFYAFLPHFLKDDYIRSILPIIYILSFLLVLLTPGGLIRNMITIFLLQLGINPLLWKLINKI
ncbi:MAG TPA: hypothetical protein VF820_04955 [Patescibacteria group bacterium]